MMDDLCEFLAADPFIPFRVVLTSGNSYEVRNPGLVAVVKTSLGIYYERTDGYAVLRLNQVAAFETISEPTE